MTTASKIYGLSAVAQSAIVGDMTTGITAAGTTQATATAITTDNNFVSTTAAGTGVVLPSGEPGKTMNVYNGGANTLTIYPPVGGTINQGTTNTGWTVLAGASADFLFRDATTIVSGATQGRPFAKYTAISSGNGTSSAGDMEGANNVYLLTSGATALTTRTAAQIYAGVPNAYVGQTYVLRVINTNGGTLTLTGGTGVTITGTATLATNSFRDFMVTLTSSSVVGFQSIGTGTTS